MTMFVKCPQCEQMNSFDTDQLYEMLKGSLEEEMVNKMLADPKPEPKKDTPKEVPKKN